MSSENASVSDLNVKVELRRAALARRDALASDWRAEASRAIAQRALDLPELTSSGPVACYWPIRSEVDPRPLGEMLAGRGLALALPVVTSDGLVFRVWRPGDPLEAAGFGTMGPLASAPAIRPAVLLVPLAAFDRACHRIGYGAGFYDRAIEILRASGPLTMIGLAFAAQEVEHVPAEPHDRALDAIVTEAGVIRPAML
jgi:5-formyltetrahydrofolate cyclo-ligase